MNIVSYDAAKCEDQSIIRFGFRNTCVEELKEIWRTGDEYPVPEYQRKQLGLPDNCKLVVISSYNAHGITYLNLWIKYDEKCE